MATTYTLKRLSGPSSESGITTTRCTEENSLVYAWHAWYTGDYVGSSRTIHIGVYPYSTWSGSSVSISGSSAYATLTSGSGISFYWTGVNYSTNFNSGRELTSVTVNYDSEGKYTSNTLSWYISGGSGGVVGNGSSSTASVILKLPDTCKLTLSKDDDNGGTVSSDYSLYDSGQSATVTATTNSGYKFLGWFKDDVLQSSNESYTFTIDSNTTLVAKWSKSYIRRHIIAT